MATAKAVKQDSLQTCDAPSASNDSRRCGRGQPEIVRRRAIEETRHGKRSGPARQVDQFDTVTGGTELGRQLTWIDRINRIENGSDSRFLVVSDCAARRGCRVGHGHKVSAIPSDWRRRGKVLARRRVVIQCRDEMHGT